MNPTESKSVKILTKNPAELVAVSSHVHAVIGPASNWVIVTSPSGDFTLIDTGYPGDFDLLLESIETLSLAPEQCSAILVTHGHIDHIGNVARFVSDFGAQVFAHELEAPNLRGERKEQVSPGRIYRNCWDPKLLRWAIHALKAGGKELVRVQELTTFVDGEILNVPGHPQAIHAPGHTSGNTAYLIEDGLRILVSGDGLVTGHAISRKPGTIPQELHRMFHTERSLASSTFDQLAAMEVGAIIPGHGRPYFP